MSVCIEIEVCKGCGICVAACPKKILKMSIHRNAKGAETVEQIDPEKCVKCGTCQDICPDLAIWVCETEDSLQ
jgi:2-oxoglutarate ferredoxin oxidoreductase subunit delta